MRRRLVVLAAISCGVSVAHAQAFTDVKSGLVDYSKAERVPRQSCESLSSYKNKEVVEIHATQTPAAGATPAYCDVTGTLSPEIAIEVSLPDHWNGRFYMIGNGGHAGEALENPFRVSQRDAALQMGFAFAQTNTGHDTQKEPGATFVLSNPQKAIDYAYRAVHLTATTAKAITAHYYAEPIARSYWNSCSNGGRQGLIEAERYPEDFDGLVVNAPWVSQTGFTMGALWNQKALDAVPITASKLALVSAKVMEKCDALDGVKDGLIEDPRLCKFDAHVDVPSCAAGQDGDNCLTAPQANAIMSVYGGPRTRSGKAIFPGYMPGSEAPVATPRGEPTSAWIGLIVPPTADGRAGDFNLAEDTMRYLVFTPPRPDYDYRTFDFDRDPPLLQAWSRKVDASSTDLTRFRARGGKLLMTYGWADQVLQPLMGVDYYEKVTARYGARTMEFFRLFMVPGMTHCSGGNGTDRFDPVSAMVDWVEKSKAPDVLHASRVVDERVVRTRPLCTYPKVARYGKGSIDDAANFSCELQSPQ